MGKLPLKIIVPLTEWKEKYNVANWMVCIKSNEINGLGKDSAADCFQIRSVSQERLIKQLGNISSNELNKIKLSISIVVDF